MVVGSRVEVVGSRGGRGLGRVKGVLGSRG